LNGGTCLTLEEARALVRRIMDGQGLSGEVGASLANALIAAESEGQPGHGLSRIPAYLSQLKVGKVNPEANPSVRQPMPSAVFVDADGGFAFPALDLAFENGSELARKTGIAAISVHHSHHCGSLGYQVERFASQGLLAIMVANAPKAMAPWGGKQPIFGTNPIAFATPVEGCEPIVIDLSLSRVARGKVMLAAREGRDIPDNWALDVDGNPTTDPQAALAGTMAPIGDAKGTALAMMVEVLAAALTGSTLSCKASSFFDDKGSRPSVGQFIIAIDPRSGADGFAESVRELAEAILSEPGVRLPGMRRHAAILEAEANGIQVNEKLFKELMQYPGAAG
jgi:(2R)-3-sulfolactate dehydrogenase (NADP+)